MPIARFSFGICVYGEWIFVVSGLNSMTQRDFGQQQPQSFIECDRYNIKTNEWHAMPDLPEGRVNPSLIVLQHTLYCIGGCTSETNNIYSLDLRFGNSWQTLTGSLPILG